ncbi:MAG: M48 family metallopeptidase [Gammaproteobacteria bacterium]|nr:M48 family metallopeptidase [Gammaproteobacteria bacterium]MDP2140695.1 M48 family metallopeptidase [Gammaproteobacteria bacterium]MDP2346951.1 M48 family metallopeptidase [Gammaproteobacteria bacterium]
MDFFRSQDIARRNTVRLVVLFLLALLSLIAITNLLIMFALGVFANTMNVPMFERIDWRLFAAVTVGILAVVGFGSLYKVISLSGGGARVAEMMQGRLILSGTQNLAEQKILNVVEEMAIASGTPVPPVYLMEEDAINAFAAGYSPADAVIGITRGAIEKLSRDELQGVVAHEFSHILHGDMRLNIRLIGILHGIMVLGMMGYYLVRTTRYSRRSKNGGNIAVVGIGLMVIGYAGTFFGNLIKSAVSRQREFLADASAVQYTRNPDGIADALKRIGSNASGSILENPGASEISHALFSNGVRLSINSLFATHPPLDKRIRRIQPNWDGSFDVVDKPQRSGLTDGDAARPGGIGTAASLAMIGTLLAQAGNPQETDLQQARSILNSIPQGLLDAAHDPFSARALVYLLLLDSKPATAQKQMTFLRERADGAVFSALEKLLTQQVEISSEIRMPLISLCLPALRQLSREQYPLFRENIVAMVLADGRISLWEWALQRVLLHQLDAVFQPHNAFHHQRRHSLHDLASQCTTLLAFLVRAGKQPAGEEASIFSHAISDLGLPAASMPDTTALATSNINAALDALVTLKPLQKPAFLKACAFCIGADGVASVQEMDIFRAIAAAIDCPLPPIPLQSS